MAGKPNDKLKYLDGLNEKDFPFLIGDILSIHFRHYDVKVMDGTGDGKRDIFSIDRRGNKVVTQCKFHYDFNKTSGSSETDEIIIALNKFNYNQGFFCTSGRLSPQSKREYKDNYKNFNLNWLEGHEIVDIVLDNSILRKIWFESEKIHLVNNKIALPFILRKQPEDTLIEYKFPENLNSSNELNFEVANNKFINSRQLFPLSPLSIKESRSNFGHNIGYIITLSENTFFNSVNNVKQEILRILVNDKNLKFESSYVSIRFGIPYFPKKEESYRNYGNGEFNLPENGETYILYEDSAISEYDFLIPVSTNWKLPDRIHMSQLNDFCYYNRDIDIVFYLEYTCDANKDLHPHVESSLEEDKIIWSKSLFIMVNSNSEKLFNSFKPNKIYTYGSSDKLLCWIHPIPTIYPADINLFERSLKHDEFENLKKEIIDLANIHEIEIIDWEKASKIAAVNNDDPFPANPQTTYRQVDIFENFNTIPSPLRPNKRTLNFECVFRISHKNDEYLEKKIESFGTHLDDIKGANRFDFIIDDQTNYHVFLRVSYTPNYQPHISTLENLKNLNNEIENTFDNIEKIVKNIFLGASRKTKDYWLEELGIFLDINT
ncbi:restriction endonuclease [Flavobacterium sp. CYK-4]|uniref:restriction endonuclease n=1 Tax=Flavobacterium lotistagni TaxID=2709660 RepID=UPI00140D3523|nr:restriction endonuclease [Flavobacterium lotistagni]NHM07607.1 restriction endonuclease [Flavobacterium lotistagni]